MKKLILFLLITMSVSLSAQTGVRLGFTLPELKAEFGYSDWVNGVTEEGIVWWSRYVKGTCYMYFFNANQVTYMCVLDPEDMLKAQGWIEFLNKNYVIIDEYHWKQYKEGYIINAELVWLDKYVYPFLIFQ